MAAGLRIADPLIGLAITLVIPAGHVGVLSHSPRRCALTLLGVIDDIDRLARGA